MSNACFGANFYQTMLYLQESNHECCWCIKVNGCEAKKNSGNKLREQQSFALFRCVCVKKSQLCVQSVAYGTLLGSKN